MTGHGANELVALEGEQLAVAPRSHGRCPRDVPQQSDLPEEVARTELPDVLAVYGDLQVAALNHVEEIARVALTDHDLPGFRLDGDQLAREVLDRGQRERREERESAEQRRERSEPVERVVNEPDRMRMRGTWLRPYPGEERRRGGGGDDDERRRWPGHHEQQARDGGCDHVGRLSIVLIETFDAVSSPGVEASDGSRAAWVGRCKVETIATMPASA